MRLLVSLCLLLVLSITISGCIDADDEDEEPVDEPQEEPRRVTKTWEATFGGTVPAGTPGHMDETSEDCTELTGGEEGVTYEWASFDVNHTPSQAELVLGWEAEDVGGVWNFPDLELRLVDPDGEYIDQCEGVTGNAPETLSLPLTKQGTYEAQIISYAGVMVDYELNVTLQYEVLEGPEASED